ncbi:8480_t:CDS:2 [Acaulospora morrowiae]|uniref:8480_t:CDS:1 n=1 Tax=Acaulospora morrowiae TaxID=94023 RepID=A0A9N8Z054_9GLOM|nr:8480_t:CDS:2 [Acaulospora morrowiae]
MQIFGLVYEEVKPVPLQNVKVEANVVDMIAEIIIQQTYKNVENNLIEAVYKFPIYEAAVICGFEAEIDGGRTIKGIVKESKEAVKEYDAAIKQGHGAYLLEEKLADVFQCTVGNIASGQTVVIKITYITELKHDADSEQIRFVLPTAIAPRYGSPHGDNTSIQESISYSSSTSYHLDLNVTCRMTSSIQTIVSPSHHISTEVNIDGDPKVAKITLAEGVTYLEKDFVLVVKSLDLDVPRAFVEYNSTTDTNCVMLTLVPKFALNETLVELIFIIDRSGSMGGEPIQKAAQTLQLLLRSLPEGCYFNVVSFGSHHDSLFPQSQLYSEVTLTRALDHAKSMDANYGGTEIYDPLKWAFENSRFDMQTSVFLLTDGEVWDVGTLVELIRTNVEQKKDQLRLFSIGIGNSVSHNLVESVARAGKGYAQYVTISERMDKKIIGMLKNAIKPPVKDYKIIWTENESEYDDLDKKEAETKPTFGIFDQNHDPPSQDSVVTDVKTKQAPFVIPPIYSGVRFIVYCMLAKGVNPNKEIMLTAHSPDGPMKLNIPLDPTMLQGSKIHTLASRKLIQDLEDGASFIHKHPKNKGKSISVSVIEEQVVYLGIKFNLASKYTSFLAIDQSDNKSVGKLIHPEKREVPIHRSFSSFNRISQQATLLSLSNRSSYQSVLSDFSNSFVRSTSSGYSMNRDRRDYILNEDSLPMIASSPSSSYSRNPVQKLQRVSAELKTNFKESKIEVLYEFLKFQSFNGEFNSASFYLCFGKKEAKDFKEIGVDNEKILCTALAIEYLEVVMFGQFREECEMCWEKANKALRKLVNEKEFDDVLKKVRDWILKWVEAS